MQKDQFSFKKEYSDLPACKQKEFKETVKKELKIKSDQGFYKRMNGESSSNPSEIKAIINLFNDYGISINQK